MKKIGLLLCLLLGLTACGGMDEEVSFVENSELIYAAEVSPNEEYIENEMDKVISERKVNFVNGGIELIVDAVDHNTK